MIWSSFSAACPLFVLALLPPYNDLSFGEVFPCGIQVGSLNGSLGWSNHGGDVFVLQRFLGILLKKNGRHCL